MADAQPAATVAPERALAVADRRHDEMIGRLEHLVTIPSVSAAPAPPEQVRASADAVAELLTDAGLEHVHQASVGDSHPYVIGDWLHHDDAPTVLLYAHHDVQPPGIVENWASDPFTPRHADGRLYGRGSADDKAGAVVHAAAIAAWLEAEGGLPCNVRVMIEGEEEIGSPHLDAFLAAHIDELAADVLVLADAGNWRVGTPAITYGLRGLVGLDVEVRALAGPVHSGLAGGVVPDPAMALSIALASLTDARGEIAVPGFADDVRVLSDDERRRLEELDGGDESLRRAFGVSEGAELTGDPDRTIWERLWFRPSLTVIGFDSHPIAGSSNQIVARATARLSVRLAAGQDPERALARLTDHLRAHVPWHLPTTITPHESAPGWVCEPTGWAFAAADRALERGFGKPAVHMGIGGSIPFVGPFAEAFGGIPALLLGPADPSSAIHGENESVHLGDLAKLTASEIHLLAELGGGRGAPTG